MRSILSPIGRALHWLEERLGELFVIIAYGVIWLIERALCLLGRCDEDEAEAW